MRWLISCLTLGITCLLPASSGPSPVMAQAPGGYGSPAQPGYAPSSGPPQPVAKAEVGIYDDYFEPAAVLVTPGATVRFVNRGHHKHTVTDYAGMWDSRDIPPGGSYTLTVKQPLHTYYYCRHHRLTMKGTILVQERDAITPASSLGGYLSPGGGSQGGHMQPGSSGGYRAPSTGYQKGYPGMMRPGTMPSK